MGAGRRQVIWAGTAARALSDAIEYVASDSPQAARQLLDAALDAADRLAEFSERGRVVPEIGSPSVRELFVYKYRLIYEVHATEIAVVAFLHGARDFTNIKPER